MITFPALQDVKIYQDAKAIREWLCQISGLIPRLNEDPNCYYGNTLSGLSLIEYYGGPSAVGTPFGQWCATGGGCCNDGWRELATERLGLILLVPETNTAQGTYGPVWKITKNLEGETIQECSSELTCGFTGLLGKTYLASLNLSTADIRSALEPRLNAMRSEKTSRFFNGGNELYHISDDADDESLLYDLSTALWHEMKKKINYYSWDDRVTNSYARNCYTQSAVDLAVKNLGIEDSIHCHNSSTIYTIEDYDGILTHLVVLQSYPLKISKVYCKNQKPVTAKDMEIIYVVLAPRGIRIEDDD